MKPITTFILPLFVYILFFQAPFLAKAGILKSQSLFERHDKCENALIMDCQSNNYLVSDFLYESSNVVINLESCILGEGQGFLREFWLAVNFSGSNVYYLDGYGVNEGIEIYTGSCGNLEMVDCVNALGDDTFIGFFPPVSEHYYIRLLGYNMPGTGGFEVSLNCGMPEPACEISIDSLKIGKCVSDSGTVSVFMSGSIAPEPYLPLIFAEVTTDMGLFIFSGQSVNELWEASFEVSGSVINYVSVFCGNSASGCSDALAGRSLPTMSCDSLVVSGFTGLIDWNVNCGRRSGEVKLYVPGTNILIETYSVFVSSNGMFEIENPPVGIFDIVLKVDGYLSKGFSNVDLPLVVKPYDSGILICGDVNGDGIIDILDLSTMVVWFNKVLPNDNSLNYLDQNCDGIINVLDVASIIGLFGKVGDIVPLD